MKKQLLKYFLFALCVGLFVNVADAQKGKKRVSTKRAPNTKTTRTTKNKTKTKIQSGTTKVDSIATAAKLVPPPLPDTLPLPKVRKSLRPDEAVETSVLRDRTPLPYEHLRADDAVFRHKIWREIDTRERSTFLSDTVPTRITVTSVLSLSFYRPYKIA